MHIKSIEIRGFKSFHKRARIDFEPGLLVLVGPNGSGKSNIVDAILWVMGEQSAKLLRGSNMDDVIFAGNSSKPALNTAEVTITLDNLDNSIPLDFNEISVTRRLLRSGDSQYFINGTTSRLGDVREILAEAALGKGLYSVISQGRIDEVLSGRPEDRRMMVDEAAGILKHRLRKDKTIRKLNNIEDKILRAKDIHREIKRQLNPILKQAESAKKYEIISSELKNAEIRLNVCMLTDFKSKWEETEKKLSDVQSKKNAISQELEKIAAQRKVEEERIEKEASRISATAKQLESLVRLSESFNGQRLLLQEKIKNASRQKDDLDREIKTLKEKSEQLKNSNFNEIAKKLEGEIDELSSKISTLGVESNSLKNQLDLIGNKKSDLLNGLNNENSRKSILEQKMNMLESEVETGKKIKISKNQINQLSDDLEKLTKQDEQLTVIIKNLQKAGDENGQKINDLQSRKASVQIQIDKLTEELNSQKQLLAKTQGRLDLYEMLFPNLREKKSDNSLFELLGKYKLGEKLLDKVKLALLDNLYSPIFENVNDLIKFIGSENGSDAILMNDLLPGEIIDDKKLSNLSDLILKESNNIPAPVLKYFSNFYLTESIEDAVDAHKKYAGRYVFVSKDGAIYSDGTIKVSRSRDYIKSYDAVKTECTAIQEKLKLAEIGIANKEDERAIIYTSLDEANNESVKVKSESDKATFERNRLTNSIENIKANIVRESNLLETQKKLLSDNREKTSLYASELKSAVDQIETFKKEISSLDENKVNIAEKISEIDRKIIEQNKNKDEIANKLFKLKIEMNDPLNIDIEKFEKERGNIAKYLDVSAKLLENISFLSNFSKEIIATTRETQEKSVNEESIIKSNINEIEERVKNLEKYSQELLDIEHGCDIKQAEFKIETEMTVKKIVEELETPLDQAVTLAREDDSEQLLSGTIEQLKIKLSRIGPVNPIAVSELKELEERNSFYEDQLKDLSESKRTILKVVDELDDLIVGTFGEIFSKISQNFAEIVSMFFPGGSGKVVLSDEANVLNSGIDLIVNPKGKNVRGLSLLSGGEKSMAALAFIFSLFLSRITPFCIMDEVDAALDDFNLTRFVKMLSQISEKSQLLIITHQKKTMESADVIYGVSLDPDGSSTVICQKAEVFA